MRLQSKVLLLLIDNYGITLSGCLTLYSLVIMRLQSKVLLLLIDNYGITLVQWKMDVDTKKVE